jgi:hypothetical protein
MARAGIVHRNPGGTDEPGTQDVASLGEETVLALDQQADHLALARISHTTNCPPAT